MRANTGLWSYLTWFLLEREIFQTNVVEKIHTHILCSVIFENHAMYEVTWKNIVEVDRSWMTIWRMRVA